MRFYAGDMNLIRKDEKKVCRNANIYFFRKQNVKNFFSSLNVL